MLASNAHGLPPFELFSATQYSFLSLAVQHSSSLILTLALFIIFVKIFGC